jgi:ethanolamine transporter EutH
MPLRSVKLRTIAERFLRAIGTLLVVLGIVHLIATPHMPSLLNGSPPRVYQQAVGPTLLNHVLVGILLLPLGFTTWLAAATEEGTRPWARRVLMVNAAVVFSLPVSVAIFMRQPQYYTAPLFLAGVGLVAVISLLMIAASVLLVKGARSKPVSSS